jgi:4-amino-4-deoxy-L-arabinose transferase-like glycosyltransferase
MGKYFEGLAIYKGILIVYLLFLAFSLTTVVPYVDSYYYWLWSSSNLQLSYYDGPPLIAYAIRISTLIFENSVFAINFVGFFTTIVSSVVVFYIIKSLTENAKQSFKVTILFLFSYTVVAHRIITFVTYDGLENLFELMMILFTIRYLVTYRVYYIYLIGVAAGFGLLAKYSTIVPIAIVFGYFLLNPKLRNIFAKPHVYISMILCCIIFSPVIIWNYLNNWVSFSYQLSFHTHKQPGNILTMLKSAWYYIGNAVIAPNLVLILIMLVFLLCKYYKLKLKNKLAYTEKQCLPNSKVQTRFLYTILVFTFLFWLCASLFADIPDRYLLYFHSILLILTGITLLKFECNKVFAVLLLYNMCLSVGDVISHSLVVKNPTCYTHYILDKRLSFNSIFKLYIKSPPNASNFCYFKIKEPGIAIDKH